MSSIGRCPRPRSRARGAFTLIETLITAAVIAVLVGLLMPALGRVREQSRGFACQVSLKSIAFDFSIFADDQLHGDRGDDTGATFALETFVESEYGVDEFWASRWGAEWTHTMSEGADDPMRCPSVRGEVTLRRGAACRKGAVTPFEHVSFGFNGRLDRAEVVDNAGMVRAVPVRLTQRILEQPGVPLAWDVDGRVAQARGVPPFFTAPALDSRELYAGDRLWFPGLRHVGAANFAFADGHVRASRRPLDEPGWRWEYQPVHP